MNERIKELADKIWSLDIEPNPHFQLCLQAFAELIVRECARSLWTEECHTSDLAVEEFNRNSKKIKQHFGVA